MLLSRCIFTRPGLRLFHLAARHPQQEDVPHEEGVSEAPEPRDVAFNRIIEVVESSPSTHRGAAPTSTEPGAPHEIFDAWNVNSFYAPLAFLRSRRIKDTPKRKIPQVGPGAADAARDDAFRQLNINPIYEANNQVLMSNFVSSMGRIQPRAQTRLSWRSQRMVTQAIKRSKHKGVIPITGRPRFYVSRT